MKLFLTLLLTIATTGLNAANNVKEKNFYGTDFKVQNVQTVKDVVSNFDKYKKKDILIQAETQKVCSKKGCWMTTKLGDKSMRIKFKDYAFFVPMSLQGKKIYVKGQMTRSEVSVKDRRHYLKDAGASAKEIAAITRPSYEFQFTASGVKLVK